MTLIHVSKMTLIHVSKMTNMQLDYAVATLTYPHLVWGETFGIHWAGHQIVIPELDEPDCYWHPTNDWAITGPIIDKHIGNVWKHNKLYEAEPDVWSAAIYTKYPTEHQAAGAIYSADGPTALIAICRTYVFAQLGEEISIPEELL